MLIVDDKVLKASGLDYATALALLKPAAEEVVVHVTRCLEAPPVPQPAADHPEPQADLPGISIPVIPACATDYLSAAVHGTAGDGRPEERPRHHDLAGQADDDLVGPPNEDDAPIGRRLRQDHLAPGRQGDDLGHHDNFTALADMARDKRMTLTFIGGVYTLIGAFKMMHFQSLAQVADCMRHNRYD